MEQQLLEALVLPIDYQEKVYRQGAYEPVYGDYKIESKNDTTYLPIRLMADLISDDRERWDARWDAAKPDEVLLVCTYMEKIGEIGWNSIDKPQTTVKLQVGSKKMIYNKQEIVLSAAPEKMNGRIVLPLRAIGEALDRQIAYRDGLIFISRTPLKLEGNESGAILKEMKGRLLDTRKTISDPNPPTAVYNIDGEMFYMVSVYESDTNQVVRKLYRQHAGQSSVLVKEIPNSVFIEEPFAGDTFYYAKADEGKVALYAYNMRSKKDEKLEELNITDKDFSWIARVIPQNDKVYFVVHFGDWTMGGEILYCIQDGEIYEVIGAKQFGSMIIEDGKIYYSDMSTMLIQDNLYVYDTSTEQKSRLGEEGYTYDITRVLTENGGGSLGIHRGVQYMDHKLYSIGYEEAGRESASLYRIDPATGESQKLTSPISKYWIKEDRIYYIDIATKYLMTANLQGEDKKTLIHQPIGKVSYEKGNFYYTLSSDGKETTPGLYKYSPETDSSLTLSEKMVKSFYITDLGVYYISIGYDAGLYKLQEGATICLERDPAVGYLFDGEQILFYGLYEEEISVIR